MAITYTIQPNPHWVIIDNFSKLPNGAAIYTYNNLNPSQFRPAFQDSAGTIPYGEYIQGFGNGTMPPIFWQFDSDFPDEGYYIRVYDRPMTEPGAQFLWDFNNLFGGSGGGGGGVTTSFLDIENFVVNGEFYSNSGTLPTSGSSVPVFSVIAPGNHAGFTGAPNSPGDGPVAYDIIFAKSNTTATDTLSFPSFSPPGVTALAPNPTPLVYFNYTCTGAGSGETYKFIQIPLVKGLQNTSGQTVSAQVYARLNSGTNNVLYRFRQFFGNGNNSPSADVLTVIGGGPLALIPGSWVKLTFSNLVIPSIAGKTLGNCGNDALYLQIALPLSPSLINLDIALPSVFLNPTVSATDFHTEDYVNAVTNSPRTGDVRTSLNSFLNGWVRMNDGTIGSASSGATSLANISSFPLFRLIWSAFSGSQSLAPMYTSGGVPVVYGSDPESDFTANRQLSLTRNLGRVMAGALPQAASQSFTRNANSLDVTSSAGFYTGMAVTVSGGGLPSPLVAGVTYFAIVNSLTSISVASSSGNALSGIPITLTGAGSGTLQSVFPETLGSFTGEEAHILTQAELPASLSGITIGGSPFTTNTPGGSPATSLGPPTTSGGSAISTNSPQFGGGSAHNTIQTTVYMNIFMKL